MTGIILAGGKNTRINTNKSFLNIESKTIIEIIAAKFQEIFDEIIIVTNSFKEYKYLNVQLVKDIIPDKGSLGGLYSGLVNSKNNYNFVVACDMPFLNPDLIKYMENECDNFDPALPKGLSMKGGVDVIIPKLNSGYEALHSIYSKNCIAPIEKQLKQDNLKITDFFPHVKVQEINEDIIKQFDSQLLSFFNINTDADYQHALNIAPRHRT